MRASLDDRRAAGETVATRRRRLANCRRDFHHETARALVERHDVIAIAALIGDPKVIDRARRANPRLDPHTPVALVPNGAATKTGRRRGIPRIPRIPWAGLALTADDAAREEARSFGRQRSHLPRLCAGAHPPRAAHLLSPFPPLALRRRPSCRTGRAPRPARRAYDGPSLEPRWPGWWPDQRRCDSGDYGAGM